MRKICLKLCSTCEQLSEFKRNGKYQKADNKFYATRC